MVYCEVLRRDARIPPPRPAERARAASARPPVAACRSRHEHGIPNVHSSPATMRCRPNPPRGPAGSNPPPTSQVVLETCGALVLLLPAGTLRRRLLPLLAAGWATFHVGVMLCMPNVAYLPSAIGYVLLLPPWAPAPPRQGRMRELGPAATVVGARSCAPDDGAKFVGDGGEDTIRCDPRTWSGEVIRLVVGRLVACGFAAAALWHAEMWPLTCVPMFAHLRTEAWRVGGDGGCVPPFALEQLSRERLSLIGTPSGFASLSLVFTDLDAGGDGGDGGATVALRRRRFDRRVVYARGHGSRLRGRDRLSEWPTCVRSIAVSAVQAVLFSCPLSCTQPPSKPARG